jgi:hypothetical protein
MQNIYYYFKRVNKLFITHNGRENTGHDWQGVCVSMSTQAGVSYRNMCWLWWKWSRRRGRWPGWHTTRSYQSSSWGILSFVSHPQKSSWKKWIEPVEVIDITLGTGLVTWQMAYRGRLVAWSKVCLYCLANCCGHIDTPGRTRTRLVWAAAGGLYGSPS